MMTSRSSVRPGGIGTRLREVGGDLATTINRLIQTALMNGATEMGAALLRRRLFRLFIGVFARGRSLFGSFCAGTAPRTAPTRLFRAASPA